MKPQRTARTYSEMEIVRLVWLAIFVSGFSFLFYNRQGDVLLYGDAVAHINIARRVFDSQTPGLLQLGTVWLPLPHLLILPFILLQRMWQTGVGGSIPSMAAYVFGVLGMFRLMRTVLRRKGEVDEQGKSAAWLAAIAYAANPNLIYIQATAMGEPLYLAFFIWALAFFAEFSHGKTKALTKCGWCLAAACLTRYDGWFLAGVLVVAAWVLAFRRSGQSRSMDPGLRNVVIKFSLIAAAAPIFWLAYNFAVYGNSLEFANGPYSAKAIEIKTGTVNPAKGNPVTAGFYFVKAAELNIADTTWMARLWLALALLGSIVAAFSGRGRLALLLWVPLPFYASSLAYGSVPIFVPPWWPYSFYNLRYGLQLLPAFALFMPLGIAFLVQSAAKLPRFRSSLLRWAGVVTLVSTLAIAAASDAEIWRSGPVCYREAKINMRGRVAMDAQLANWMKWLPDDSTLLMYLGEHSGALEQAGIALRRVINEGNHRVWKQPLDPDGLWEKALADPAAFADFVVGFEGDPVWKAAQQHHLKELVEIHTTGQAAAVIFQGRAGKPPAPAR